MERRCYFNILASHSSPLVSICGLGVGVFFVLSGYLMSDLLFIKKWPCLIFLFAGQRILPAFIFFVFAMLAYANWMQPVKYSPSTVEIFST